jgi:hypothetical protein
MIVGTCKGCDGFVRHPSPMKRVADGVYHHHCYDREQEKEKQRAHAPNLSVVPSPDNGGTLQGNDTR